MDTREWKERFDRLKPEEQLDVLMAFAACRAETPAQKRERHMLYLQMLALVGINADDCHGLVAGDEDVLWLSKKDIWLYRCWSCNSVYYAYKTFWPQRRCPYCKYDSNEPLDNYYDIKKAIAEIEDRVSVRYREHRTIQQIIEGDGINGNG